MGENAETKVCCGAGDLFNFDAEQKTPAGHRRHETPMLRNRGEAYFPSVGDFGASAAAGFASSWHQGRFDRFPDRLIRASDDSDGGGLYAPSPKRWLWRVGNLKPAGTKESLVKTGTSLGGLWRRFRRARSIPFCFFFRVIPNPEPSREGGRVVAQSAARRQCFQQL